MDIEKTEEQEQDEIPAELTASYSEISFNSNIEVKNQEENASNKVKRPDSLTCDKKKGG